MGLSRVRRHAASMVACVALVMAGTALTSTPADATPHAKTATTGVACVPTVEGPVPVDPSSPAFVAVLQAALPSGFVDEEFFISCSSPDLTYKTAVFVRRPATMSRASGVVAVEALHSSGIWGMQTLLQPYFVAHDDIHVGVAASRDVVEGLVKKANPTRYASLDVPATPDATNQILAGVGALLHQPRDPLLPGARVKAPSSAVGHRPPW